jgi:hypothetical protein
MALAPKLSPISNVFGLNEPQHMISKLYFELLKLMDSLSVWTKSESGAVRNVVGICVTRSPALKVSDC